MSEALLEDIAVIDPTRFLQEYFLNCEVPCFSIRQEVLNRHTRSDVSTGSCGVRAA